MVVDITNHLKPGIALMFNDVTCKERLITKECMAVHTNLILPFKHAFIPVLQ